MSGAPRARGRLGVGLLCGILWLALAGVAQGQGLQFALADSTGNRAARRDLLGRTIALRLSDVTVEQALRAIAAQGGTRLAYAGDLLPAAVRVTIARERITLGDAFREALRATDLDIVVTPSGYVVIVRSPWPRVRPPAESLVVVQPPMRPARPQIMDRVLVMGTPASGAPERSLATAVSVRSNQQLTQHGLRSMSQIFRTGIPGVVAWDLGIAGPLAQLGSVRGSSSFTSNYLKTYVDGVELASPYLLFAIDPFSVDRVEVIRGPQGSAMYGSDAISGVVQVVTRKGSPMADWRPQFDGMATLGRQESRFTAGASAVQRHSAMAFTGGGLTSLGLGATWEDVGAVVAGGSAGTRGTFGGVRTVAGPLRLDATFRYADIRFTSPDNPLLRRTTTAALAAVRPLLQSQRIENETYGVTADYQPREWWRQTLVVGLDRHNGSIPPQREPATVADALLGATQEAASKASLRYSMAVRVAHTEDATLTATLGAERATLLRDRLGFREELIGVGTGLTALYSERVNNGGAFAQLKADIANTVFLTAGLRGERNSNFGDSVRTAWAPMLGVAVTRDVGSATLKGRAAYGKGIRPPAPSMRRAIRTINYRQAENPLLEPEVQSGTEGGLELYVGDRLTLAMTGYSQRADGLIQQVIQAGLATPRERARVIQYQNVGRIDNRGIEVEGSARAGLLRAELAWSHTDSRVRALAPTYTGDLVVGDRVPEVPSSSGLASLSLEGSRLQGTVGVSYIGPWNGYNWLDYYAGELGDAPALPALRSYLVRYPSLTRPFVGVAWTMSRHAEWYLRAENLTNLQRNERDDLQIGAGRTVTVGLRVVR